MKKLRVLSIAICFLFASIVSIFSSTTLAMDSLPDEGTLYKIKNAHSDNCLNVRGMLGGVLSVKECVQDKYESRELWSFERDGGFYKIKNRYNGNLLYHIVECKEVEKLLENGMCKNLENLHWRETAPTRRTMHIRHLENIPTRYPNANSSNLWTIEKNGEFYKLSGKFHSNNQYLSDSIDYAGRPHVSISDLSEGKSWYFIKYDPYKYNLFTASVARGAAYSFLPEFVKGILEARGHSGAPADVAAIIVQGGITLYSTASYIPVMTGMVVRGGFHQLGFSQQTSAIAGSTASVLAVVSQNLSFNQDTFIDCVVDCSIAIAGSSLGSYLTLKATPWVCDIASKGIEAGSTLTSKAKSWMCGILENNIGSIWGGPNQILLEKDKEIESLKKERDELYALTSGTQKKGSNEVSGATEQKID